MIQCPAELPGVAIVIRGSQGAGKSIFVDFIGALLGPHYLVLTRMEQLVGRFTGHLKDALLVCANEAVWGGCKHGEGALKSMITDQLTSIEAKGKDLYTVHNFKRIIVTTNEKWAVPMSMDDRRYLVLAASDVHKENKTYFSDLTKQMRNGGLHALLYDLQHEDLTDFDVRTKPRSTFGFDIQLRSADAVVRWFYELLYCGLNGCRLETLDDNDDWNRTPQKDVFYNSFIDYCKTNHQKPIDKSVFGKQIHIMLPGCTVGETRPASMPRARRYTLPSLPECRAAFQCFAKAGPEIWE